MSKLGLFRLLAASPLVVWEREGDQKEKTMAVGASEMSRFLVTSCLVLVSTLKDVDSLLQNIPKGFENSVFTLISIAAHEFVEKQNSPPALNKMLYSITPALLENSF